MHKKLTSVGLSLILLLLAAVPTLADSFNDAVSVNYAIDQVLWNPCAGEAVHVTGTLHMVLRSSVDPNGRYHVRIHENYANVVGVGELTGYVYRVPGADNMTLNWDFSFSDSKEAFTEGNQVRFITQGREENTLIKALFHVTVNANNELIVDLEHLELVCQ